MLRFEKGPKVYLSNETLFDGTVLKADATLSLKDVHGHFKIKTKLSNSTKIDSDSIKLVSESPITLKISSKGSNCLIVKLRGFKNEIIYGGGEQFCRLNLKGKRFPIFVQEQGIGRGWNLVSLLASLKGVRGDWYTSYFPQPVFFSSEDTVLLSTRTSSLSQISDPKTKRSSRFTTKSSNSFFWMVN